MTASGVIFSEYGLNVDTAHMSRIPCIRNADCETLLDRYQNDFFYRLLAFPRQLMYIAKRTHLYKEEASDLDQYMRDTEDKSISTRSSSMQRSMFMNCEEILRKSMRFPSGYDRTISEKLTNGIARKLNDGILSSQNVFWFRYIILRLYCRNASFRAQINKMVSPHRAKIMLTILNNLFVSSSSAGFETDLIFEENQFTKMVHFIQTVYRMYMSSFGYVRIYDPVSSSFRKEYFLNSRPN